jgi:UDP-N-acetyl-D-galactosamine dehydrogenase
LLFDRLNLDTLSVLEAAQTKWNFLPFRPGLVGGHCIGVDPYYLTKKASEVGFTPEVILAGRRVNDSMAKEVAFQVIKLMLKKGIEVLNSKVIVLGATFKENCPDLRNSKVFDLIEQLMDFGCHVDVFDPVASFDSLKGTQCDVVNEPTKNKYDAVILAVGHDEFKVAGFSQLRNLGVNNCVFYDLKGLFDLGKPDGRL